MYFRTSCQLKATLKEYFPGEKNAHHDWMKGPFKNYNKSDDLAIKEKEQLIDIATDSTLLSKRGEDLLNFWLNIATEYPEISKRATTILMPFSTTYLCEKSFSTYVATKTKYRNRLNAENEVRLQLTTIEPDFRVLCENTQAHPSH